MRLFQPLLNRSKLRHNSGTMPTDDKAPKRTEKLQLMLGPDELQAIDDWRFENRLPSRAAAIRELIRRGLHRSDDFADPPTDAASGDFRVTDD
jgi:hypothetical protein